MTMQKPTPLEKQLLEENAMLRHKLSPLEDPEFTTKLALAMAKADFQDCLRPFRKGATPNQKSDYVVITPKLVAERCFGDVAPQLPLLTNIGRSLQALLWERSAIDGNLVFVMPQEEYENGQQ